VTFPLVAVCIYLDVDWLPRLHVCELCLFEIGGHPDVIERDNINQFLPDTYVLSDFNAFLADDSRNGRTNDGEAEIEFHLVKLRPTLHCLRVGGLSLRTREGNLLRRRLRAAQVGFRLQ